MTQDLGSGQSELLVSASRSVSLVEVWRMEGRSSRALLRFVLPQGRSHTLAVLALPEASLVDRSSRRVPGHYAPLRSRALLSSNHGVSRRQAGAATYGRFSVRPLGPLRVWPRGALGLWLDAGATDTPGCAELRGHPHQGASTQASKSC